MLKWLGLLLILLAARTALAQESATDANIATGLDISDSVQAEEMRLAITGMAAALRDPRLLQAIHGGRHRRVGFALFAWHHNAFPSIVSWTIIDSEAAAETVAVAIEARLLVDAELEGRRKAAWYMGRITDISQAIEAADHMLIEAPFAAERAVINIVGDGEDNVAEGAGVARDRFVARGGTVNGLVLGEDPVVLDYYRREVIGGPGAFVMSAAESAMLAEAFVRKFIGDIVARVPAGTDMAQVVSGRQ